MRDLADWRACPPPGPVRLEGQYVIVEPYERAVHIRTLWEALGGAEGINDLIRYFPNSTYKAPEELADWIEDANRRLGFVTLVFRDKEDGEVVGMASYMRPDPANGVIEVGSVAHGAAMKRSPLSTEAHYLMARHVFEDLGYRRYEWKCHNENEPSKVTALRYGFTFEGVFRQHMISRGANRDTAWFSMIDKEWPLLGKAFETWLSPDNFDAHGHQIRRLQDIRAALQAVPA
ncbi:GNAT family protein [Rhizobium sp. SSA_523]|uniref:GNAT family N-acetyltransferase n=1 Tax=Rhizobium sp. SSA_523 TaxID=2952477 RepID=UPI00209002FF|nr:GNAT family protein [Rhizobium sp. SSA_523]MCO5731827.1 GNAT family N-acetyltransferase [Rhizobium sp. SSA_523]WKC22809.1 GNAT family protein [Rhizobium sp. SSA_523]